MKIITEEQAQEIFNNTNSKNMPFLVISEAGEQHVQKWLIKNIDPLIYSQNMLNSFVNDAEDDANNMGFDDIVCITMIPSLSRSKKLETLLLDQSHFNWTI